MKFDPSAPATPAGDRTAAFCAYLSELGISPSSPILLAGSTHPGEERIASAVLLQLRARFPDLFLIIAPRHAERAGDIRTELAALDLRLVSRSDALPPPAAKPDVLLLDTTGELRDWYPLATLVFIGKSLTAHGGQNPMEAIAAGKPVIFGPHMDNFGALAARLLTVRGAIQVQDAAALAEACARLLADPAAAAAQAAAAAAVLAGHAGAALRTADLLLAAGGFLPGSGG